MIRVFFHKLGFDSLLKSNNSLKSLLFRVRFAESAGTYHYRGSSKYLKGAWRWIGHVWFKIS